MKFHTAVLLVAIPLSACTGTETGNGFIQEIRIGARSSDPGQFALGTAEGGGVVTSAWMLAGPLTFVEDGDCVANPVGTQTAALDANDYVAGIVSRSVELNEGDFCQITVPLGGEGLLIPTDAPPQLGAQNAVVIEGATAAGTLFVIVAGAPQFAVQGASSFPLAEAEGDLLIGFDLATWLVGLDIDNGVQTDGTVLIDGANNMPLLMAFASRMAAGIELFGDSNSNGSVEPGEDAIARGQ